MKYIQEHYFHYRADESTEILGKGRKIKPAEESLRWIGSVCMLHSHQLMTLQILDPDYVLRDPSCIDDTRLSSFLQTLKDSKNPRDNQHLPNNHANNTEKDYSA